MADPAILVTVVGGYLGAGKTTLVNHILRSADERIAVLVNDFGDINIDAELIESQDGNTISLANGCICCSMIDGFGAALAGLLDATPRPRRLVVEASGVGDPGQISAYAHAPGLELDGVITMVDAELVPRQLRNDYISDVISQQLSTADLIVLNKIDLVLASERPAVQTLLAEHTAAKIIPSKFAEVPIPALLGLDRLATDPPSTAQPHRFNSWSERATEPLNREDLERTLAAVPAAVVRVKGLVRFSDAPDRLAQVQQVGARLTIKDLRAWTGEPSRLVFISLAETVGPLS